MQLVYSSLVCFILIICFLGMGPQHAMQIAERLYTQGYISYPRTETNSYPENFDLVCVLFSYSLKKVVWVMMFCSLLSSKFFFSLAFDLCFNLNSQILCRAGIE